MPVPKRKTSKSKRNMRKATKGLVPKAIVVCQTCQAPLIPHSACTSCGYYKGVKVVRTKADRMESRGEQRRAKHESLEAAATEKSKETKES